MQVIVFSSGRSGTNLVLEMLTGHFYFIPTQQPEDKFLFKRKEKLPNRYLTKSDSVYCHSYEQFYEFMKLNERAHILWTIRHPYDWALSKLYRGRPMKRRNWKYADDGTIEGCKADLFYMFELLQKAERDFSFRILRIKLEDVILNIESECKRICKWLCIPYQEEMTRPWERMRHEGKKNRYGNKLDISQISLYKTLDTVYDGFFKDKTSDIRKLFLDLKPLVAEFKYIEE